MAIHHCPAVGDYCLIRFRRVNLLASYSRGLGGRLENYSGTGLPKPSVAKVIKSEFLAFIALTSFMSGPIFLVLAAVSPELASGSLENNGSGTMQMILAIVGISELALASVLLSWKLRFVKDIFEHGIEVKSRVSSYTKDTAVAIFEYTAQGQQHRAQKHVFGRQTFPAPRIGQEVALIVHQDKPEKFVIKAQYL